MKDPEFLKQLQKVALHNPANSDIYTVDMAQFVATFHRVVVPAQFTHLFFVQGGAQAVENALKTAFDWKVRRNLAAGLGERGKSVIHFKEAFHGRSGYTLPLTNTQDPNKYLYYPLHDWPRVENPKAVFPLTHANLAQTRAAEERSLNQIRSILESRGPDIACIILEPIQGEGGDNHFTPEFWQGLRSLADQYDVLLVADEVQSGMGLTGKTWAFQHYGVTPDIVSFGKKSQVCGIMATSRIDTVKDNVFSVPSRINSTWGGNLVDMVRCKKFLEIIEEDNLIENAAIVGAHFLKELEKLQQKYPQLIHNARGKGLMCAFDCVTSEVSGKIRSMAYARHAIFLGCGSCTVRFRPPLDTSTKDIHNIIELLDNILAEVSQKPAKL